jgi:hypothetical protein
MNYYWYNNYYYYYDATHNYQNWDAATAPLIINGIPITGLKPNTSYYIDFFDTRMGSASNLPSVTTPIISNSSGEITLDINILCYIGTDSTEADFAFTLYDPSSSYRTNDSTKNIQIQDGKDYKIVVTPNPSKGIYSIELQCTTIDTPILYFIFDDIGKLVYSGNGDINTISLIDISNNPKGVYFLKTSANSINKYFKLILQ